jgi:hypothetical protein
MRTKLEAGRTLCGVEVSDFVCAPPNFNGALMKKLFCFRQSGIIIRQFTSNRRTRDVAIFFENIKMICGHSASPGDLPAALPAVSYQNAIHMTGGYNETHSLS